MAPSIVAHRVIAPPIIALHIVAPCIMAPVIACPMVPHIMTVYTIHSALYHYSLSWCLVMPRKPHDIALAQFHLETIESAPNARILHDITGSNRITASKKLDREPRFVEFLRIFVYIKLNLRRSKSRASHYVFFAHTHLDRPKFAQNAQTAQHSAGLHFAHIFLIMG